MATDLDDYQKKWQKDYGQRVFATASEAKSAFIERLSTGVLWVDISTGGGIPVGRMTMFYGKPSTGKSLLAAKVVASAQRMCSHCFTPAVMDEREIEATVFEIGAGGRPVMVRRKVKKPVPVDCASKCRIAPPSDDGEKRHARWPGPMECLWIDAEDVFDPYFNSRLGVDCDRLRLGQPLYGEMGVDMIDGAIRTGQLSLIVVDTIAHLVPIKECDGSAEDQFMAVQARMLNRAFRIWTASMVRVENDGRTKCTLLLINQLRQKLGIFPVDVRPGGHGQEYSTSVDIKLKKDGYQEDQKGRTIWATTKFEVEKNKTGVPEMMGKYKVSLLDHPGHPVGDTWEVDSIFEAATKSGIASRKGGAVVVLDKKFDGEAALLAEIGKRGEFCERLRSALVDYYVHSPSDGKLPKKKEE